MLLQPRGQLRSPESVISKSNWHHVAGRSPGAGVRRQRNLLQLWV